MISPWTVYFILMLDNISGFLGAIIFLCVATFVFSGGVGAFIKGTSDSPIEDNILTIFFNRYKIKLVFLFFICLFFQSFLPSTKQAVAIYLIPELSKSQTIRNIPEEFQIIVNNLLVNHVAKR